MPKGTALGIIYNIQCASFPWVKPTWPSTQWHSGMDGAVIPATGNLEISEKSAVRRKPLKEEVFDELHERILAGEFVPGQWLRQEEISLRLGVSMTPVREALDLVVSAGLAERVPFRGVRIIKPEAPEILNSYGMRLLLECSATYAAALHITEEDLGYLSQLLEASEPLVRLEDLPRERAISRDLHSKIVGAAGNSLLHRLYLTVLNTFPDWMLYEYLFRHPELLGESMQCEYSEHHHIVEALRAHRPELALQRAQEHVTNRGRELISYLGIAADQVHTIEAEILPLLKTRPESTTAPR